MTKEEKLQKKLDIALEQLTFIYNGWFPDKNGLDKALDKIKAVDKPEGIIMKKLNLKKLEKLKFDEFTCLYDEEGVPFGEGNAQEAWNQMIEALEEAKEIMKDLMGYKYEEDIPQVAASEWLERFEI